MYIKGVSGWAAVALKSSPFLISLWCPFCETLFWKQRYHRKRKFLIFSCPRGDNFPCAGIHSLMASIFPRHYLTIGYVTESINDIILIDQKCFYFSKRENLLFPKTTFRHHPLFSSMRHN